MKFKSLKQCVDFLEQQKEIVRIPTVVDPDLEMAEITRRVFEAGGPAIYFEKIKSSSFPAVSNLFGTYERTLKIFSPELENLKSLLDLKSHPESVFKDFKKGVRAAKCMIHSFPIKMKKVPVLHRQTGIEQLPQIRCWPEDGGAFILLPQVFSKDPLKKGILNSNMGMYRIQMSGNDYIPGSEIGLHYQIHRGIADHHQKAIANQVPLKVSVFIGGPPAHMLAAIMPLPENLPEVAFAGALAGYNFRYAENLGHIISADADFCITGTIEPFKRKKEGPFGDHLGYYSNAHEFPYLRVESVFHRKDAIYPFTVVGRPPQEDTNFGRLIHEMTRTAVTDTIPGVTAVNAVDDAGVHPLLLAKAHERYIPYRPNSPREILTCASALLGTGQLSLAKYLFICAHEDNPGLNISAEIDFFIHMLERVDFSSDLHFVTHTNMDTLDYSSGILNQGSKMIMAVSGPKKRNLKTSFPSMFSIPEGYKKPRLAAPGMITIQGPSFSDYDRAKIEIDLLARHLGNHEFITSFPLVVLVDDSDFSARSFSNFLWVSFTRSNPSHDIYGAGESYAFKHWSCSEPLVIDARMKPFHSKPLVSDPDIAKRVDSLGKKGGPLYGII